MDEIKVALMTWASAVFVGLALLAVSCGVSGCVNGACAKTASERAAGAVIAGDAQAKIDEARDVVSRLPEEPRKKALVALSLAQAALDGARAALAGVDHLCEGLDYRAAFADFVKVWTTAVLPFLSLLGGPGGGSQVGTPLAVSL